MDGRWVAAGLHDVPSLEGVAHAISGDRDLVVGKIDFPIVVG